MTKKKQKINWQEYTLQGVTILYLFLMIGFFPFFFDDYYLNIVWAKKSFFQWVTGGFLVVSVLIGISLYIWNQKKQKRAEKRIPISLTDIFVIVFGLTIAVSCVLSPVGSEAFWGEEGRKLGGLFLLLCVGAYFAISRCYKSSQFLMWVFLLANLVYWGIILIQFFGVDLFDMYKNLIAEQHTMFIGTMGNINVNAGYSGVAVALMMAIYYMSKEKLSQRCFWGMSVLGIYTCYCIRSDSWVLAVAITIFVLLFFAIKDKESLEKWWGVCLAFFCGSAAIKLTEVIEGAMGWENSLIPYLRTQKLLFSMVSYKVLVAEAIVLLLVFLLMKSRYMEHVKKYGLKVLIGIAVIGVVAAIVYVYPLEDYFGSSRGYIWKRTIWNFKDFSFMQKLFGYGPNCFFQSIEGNYGAEMREKFGSVFYDAHNEMLQFLTVSGIFGMISYMGMQISLLVSCIREKENWFAAVVGCVGIVAYMAQGLVNNPQVFTTPLLFLFLGIIENKIRKNINK